MNWIAFFAFLLGVPLFAFLVIWIVGILVSNVKYMIAFLAILFVGTGVLIGMNI